MSVKAVSKELNIKFKRERFGYLNEQFEFEQHTKKEQVITLGSFMIEFHRVVRDGML